jgi:hypothetical protein
MAIGHSINQQKLLSISWQNKRFINGFGVLSIHVMDTFSTNYTKVLAVFSVDGFQILTLAKTNTIVRCNFKPDEFTN